MPAVKCKCEKCGIDFISYHGDKKLCNKCGTNGPETKETTCKVCGNTFLLNRNPKDENKFEKKVICSSCSGAHCTKCKTKLTTKEEINHKLCNNCYSKTQVNFTKDDGKLYSYCTKCGKEIEIANDYIKGKLRSNKPEGKVRKLCNDCYTEFMNETKDIKCKKCGKIFTVGRSSIDGGFLIKDYCSYCYDKYIKKPEYKIRICEFCGKEFKIYQNEDGRFTEHKKYCPDCEYDNLLIKQRHNNTCRQKYGVDWSCLLPQCQDAKPEKISKINERFAKLLDKNNIKYEMEWFDENMHRHYDFYLPNKDILIEINPSYTHSILGCHYNGHNIDANKAKWNHLNRTQDIDKRVIHVWDWDNWDKIINLVKDKQRLYARNLNIKLIDNNENLKQFLTINHIQGDCRNKAVNIGLYQDSKLIQVMIFGKPRYNKNYEWELLRLCTDNNYIVIGGSNRLFNYFIDNYKPNSILSYCDNSKFDGNIYFKLGFELVKTTYPSKNWSNGNKRITDNLLRQRGYDQLFHTNYGKGTSNEQLMIDNGWLPVYDCGQKVFEWKLKE